MSASRFSLSTFTPSTTMFTLVALTLVSSALAMPQYGGYGPPPSGGGGSASSSAAAAAPSAPASTNGQVNVNVGPGGQLVFSPDAITASNGTVVTFFFPSGIPHSVTQSTFADPCTPLAAQNGASAGFDSGLQTSKQFSITITDDSQPIWFHCKQVSHCGSGMVGSINAPSSGSNTFAAFQSAAKAIGSNEKTETDNGPVTGGVDAIATATPANTAGASSPSSGSGTTSGASSSIAGAGTIVCAAVLGAIIALAA